MPCGPQAVGQTFHSIVKCGNKKRAKGKLVFGRQRGEVLREECTTDEGGSMLVFQTAFNAPNLNEVSAFFSKTLLRYFNHQITKKAMLE